MSDPAPPLAPADGPADVKEEAPATPPLIRHPLGVFLALALGAALMVIAFPDGDQDYLAWLPMVPFFAVLRGAGGRRGFFLGWLGGALIEGFGFSWIGFAIREFTGLGWLVAGLFFLAWLAYSSLSWALLGFLLGRCRRPVHLHAALLVWVGVEYYFPRLFPWHFGGVFYQREWLRQAADLFGASGLSAVVLLGNAVIYSILEWKWGRARFPAISMGVLAVLLVGINVYGALRLEALDAEQSAAPTVRAGLIQPMVLPEEKSGAGRQDRETVVRFTGDLLRRSQELQAAGARDLILWIEGANTFFAFDPEPGKDPLRRGRNIGGETVFDSLTTPLVIGGASVQPHPTRTGEYLQWNSAAWIVPAGAAGTEEAGTRTTGALYHKRKRLLFGEMLPFQEYYPDWILDRVRVGTIEAGTESPRFPVTLPADPPEAPEPRELGFRILICYEVVLPGFFRQQLGDAEFLVNLTEDIWYGRSAHIRQHESVLRMRCIENRVPLLRCTNVGPSGVVDVAGRFDQRTAVWEPEDRVVTLRAVRPFCLYRAGGYHFPWVSLVVGLILFRKQGGLRRTGRKKKE